MTSVMLFTKFPLYICIYQNRKEIKTENYKGFEIQTNGHCSVIYKDGNPIGGTSTDYITDDLSNKNYVAKPINNSIDKAKKKIDLF